MMLHAKLGRSAIITPARWEGDQTDGNYLRAPSEPGNDAAWLAWILPSRDRNAITYLDIDDLALSRSAVTLLAKHDDDGVIVATSLLENLRVLWAAGATTIRLLITHEHLGAQGPACPYTGVEVQDPLVTHELVNHIHRSGKEVYVRFKLGQGSKEGRRRLDWLRHEQVDGIVLHA